MRIPAAHAAAVTARTTDAITIEVTGTSTTTVTVMRTITVTVTNTTIRTTTPTNPTMTTDPSSFLTALRLSDSFLPVGGYTASYGLEQYINDGRVETGDDLRACSRPTSVAWSVPVKPSRWPTLTPRAKTRLSPTCWPSTSDSTR